MWVGLRKSYYLIPGIYKVYIENATSLSYKIIQMNGN
jgi:hypothetical protein